MGTVDPEIVVAFFTTTFVEALRGLEALSARYGHAEPVKSATIATAESVFFDRAATFAAEIGRDLTVDELRECANYITELKLRDD